MVPVSAAETGTVSVESVLSDIRKSQSAERNQDIKCDSVTDEQFASLGDALMDVMHPDENEHELMEQMMGGEGSKSLKAMETVAGRKYLGCISGGYYAGITGMMGGTFDLLDGANMMGSWDGRNYFDGKYGMMGGWGSLSWIYMILIWILLIAGVAYVIKNFFVRTETGKKESSGLEILKERYAKGEIDKKEFEEKRKDLG